MPFFNRQLQILDRIYGMGAHNFSLAPKVPQNGEFPVPDFVFLEMSFPTRRKFSGRLIFCHPIPTSVGERKCVIQLEYHAFTTRRNITTAANIFDSQLQLANFVELLLMQSTEVLSVHLKALYSV